MKEVNIENIIDKLNSINLIDIRDSYLFSIENIPYSINIPYNFLIMNPENYLDKEKKYYLYCNQGITSKLACQKLQIKGYNVINIKGGFNSYKIIKHKIM